MPTIVKDSQDLIKNTETLRQEAEVARNEFARLLHVRVQEIGQSLPPQLLQKWSTHVAGVDANKDPSTINYLCDSYADPNYFPYELWSPRFDLGRYDATCIRSRVANQDKVNGMDLVPGTGLSDLLKPMADAVAKLGMRAVFYLDVNENSVCVSVSLRSPKYIKEIKGEAKLNEYDIKFLGHC